MTPKQSRGCVLQSFQQSNLKLIAKPLLAKDPFTLGCATDPEGSILNLLNILVLRYTHLSLFLISSILGVLRAHDDKVNFNFQCFHCKNNFKTLSLFLIHCQSCQTEHLRLFTLLQLPKCNFELKAIK